MRGRLALSFACLALVLTSLGGAIRIQALGELARTEQIETLSLAARLIGTLVEDMDAGDRPVTAARLTAYVPDESQLTVTRDGTSTITVAAPDYDSRATEQGTRVEETVGATTITLVEDATVVMAAVRESRGPLLALLLALVLLAALVGFVVATVLSRPFHRLAESAAALGRGRFDFEVPKSKIPEVISIATSLQTSAGQLEESLQRDREFFQHASHALRTPLTGLRLELEELNDRDDLSDDVRQSTARSMADARRLECTVTELLDFARARRLVAGAEVSIVTLGSDVAQRWRDRLPESRVVRAFVDGGPDFTLTPGPVEQLLDSVLRDVSDNATGAVTLRFVGHEQHVKVTVSCGPRKTGAPGRPSVGATEMIAEVLGGRCKSDAATGELEILLPRR